MPEGKPGVRRGSGYEPAAAVINRPTNLLKGTSRSMAVHRRIHEHWDAWRGPSVQHCRHICICMWASKSHPQAHHTPSTKAHSADTHSKGTHSRCTQREHGKRKRAQRKHAQQAHAQQAKAARCRRTLYKRTTRPARMRTARARTARARAAGRGPSTHTPTTNRTSTPRTQHGHTGVCHKLVHIRSEERDFFFKSGLIKRTWCIREASKTRRFPECIKKK